PIEWILRSTWTALLSRRRCCGSMRLETKLSSAISPTGPATSKQLWHTTGGGARLSPQTAPPPVRSGMPDGAARPVDESVPRSYGLAVEQGGLLQRLFDGLVPYSEAVRKVSQVESVLA